MNKLLILMLILLMIGLTGCIKTEHQVIETYIEPTVQLISNIEPEEDINKTSHRAETDKVYYVSGSDGHEIWLENNPESEVVSLNELIEFLKEDKTDEILYNDSTFVCSDYAEVIHNNAEKQGIRTAYVTIDFKTRDYGHAINAFYVINKGIMFYDATNNEIGSCTLEYFVDLKIGQQMIPIRSDLLHESRFFNEDVGHNSYYTCNYYDIRIESVVSNIEIMW